MKANDQGHAAEAAVAKKLHTLGHKIVQLNWHTPKCEVDIISQKKDLVYLTEVKFRSKSFQGSGLDYVTPAKLVKMNRAAEIWAHETNWTGDLRLMAAEVSGDNFESINLVELS